MRGFLDRVLVEIEGKRYPVFFYTVERLSAELNSEARHGIPCIAEVGMVVVAEMEAPVLKAAVERLYESGYFNYFVSLSADQLAQINGLAWPP